MVAHAFLLSVLLAASALAYQLPFRDGPGAIPSPQRKWSPRDTYVNHFNQSESWTSIHLQTTIASHYKQPVTVTNERYFDVVAYAAASGDKLLVRELEDIEAIKRAVWVEPLRRRDGDGVVVDQLVFGGYRIAWKDYEFDAIVASYPEGFGLAVQWHIIGPEEPAHRLIEAVVGWGSVPTGVIWVFEFGYWRPDRLLWESVQKASWDDVVLDAEFKEGLQHDYRSFLKSEDTYKKLGVPWKRGLIFLGPPGNGKTISLKAMVHEIDIPTLYVKTFHSFQGDEMSIKSIFARARRQAPCLLVFEDLDSLITPENRAFFLNEVDGMDDNDGLLMIGTTNHFDRLDPSISNRPSRFDRKYNFPDPSKEQRRDYAVYWQGKLKDNKDIDFPDSLVDKFADKTDEFSFAYMKEAFVSTLILIAGGGKGSDEPFGDVLLKQVENLRKELNHDDDEARQNGNEAGMAGAGGGPLGGPPGSHALPGYSYMEEQAMRAEINRMTGQYGTLFTPWTNL